MTTATKTEPLDARDQIAPYNLPAHCIFNNERFELDDLGLDLREAFEINPSERLFVLGSCFARDAMHGLFKRAQQRLNADAPAPLGAALGHKYNAFSIVQALRWLDGERFDERFIIPLTDSLFYDGHRHPVIHHASLDEAVSIHRNSLNATRDELRTADVVALTIDSIEVWRDVECDLALNTPPPMDRISDFDARFRFHRTTHAENVAAIIEILDRLHRLMPRVRILAATSPIPLYATFTGDDILAANTYCKSVLNAAIVDAVVTARGNGCDVRYCPTFELVMLQPRRDAVWRETDSRGRPDGRHLHDTFARGIVSRVLADQHRELRAKRDHT